MKQRRTLIVMGIALIVLTFLILSGCSAATPAEYQNTTIEREVMAEEPAEVEKIVEAPAAEEPPSAPESEAAADQAAGENAEAGKTVYTGSSSQVNRPNRMIIKDGQMIILVTDTDTAIDRATQIVSDLGGYIISSRTWFSPYQNTGIDQKFGTMTIGVPVDRFEDALLRFRQIAVKVKDEQASGEDVSDEYVDLQSRLKNLEATRDRIKTFLEAAVTAEEALKVNEQLSEVEGEIEQVRGRMNYLFDRASYSTLTLQIEPEAPFLTPTPTPTITPTPTPTATPTPAVWQPRQTWTTATRTTRQLWKGVGDFLIYFFTVVFPCLLPFILVGGGIWGIVWYARRRAARKAKQAEVKPADEAD